MKNKDSHTLIELDYKYKDSKSTIFRVILFFGFLVPIFSTVLMIILSLIFLDNPIFSASLSLLLLLLIYFAYLTLFKIKITCRLINAGVSFQNRMFHTFIKWDNIKSYKISDNFVILETKGWKYLGIGFPMKNNKNKIINILNFYIIKIRK